MHNISDTERLAIFEKGLPLELSLTKFGHPDLVAEYNSVPPVFTLELMLETMKGIAEKNAKAAERQRELIEQSQARNDLRNRLEKQVAGYTCKGYLIATGFALPRKPQDYPEIIPVSLFDPRQRYVDWAKSEVKGNGLHFVESRLTVKKKQPVLEIKRPGRPSSSKAIEAAFYKLVSEGSIQTSESLLSHFPLIRFKVQEMYPEFRNSDKGLSDKALYNALSKAFEAEKSKTL